MNKKIEIINILNAELVLLAKKILNNAGHENLDDIYQASKDLHEKIVGLKLLSGHLNHEELPDIFQKSGSRPVQHEKQKQSQEEMTMGVAEKKLEIDKESSIGQIYKNISNMEFIEKDKQKKTFKTGGVHSEESKGRFSKKINVGLNDKIAFIKHLFNGDAVQYTDMIVRLNAFDSYESALNFINNEIKPKHDNWKDKDEYEFRLIQLLELKFS